jgi:hypothetical protein
MAGNRVFVNVSGFYYTAANPVSSSDQEKLGVPPSTISVLNTAGVPMSAFDLEQAIVAAQNAAGTEDQDGFSL